MLNRFSINENSTPNLGYYVGLIRGSKLDFIDKDLRIYRVTRIHPIMHRNNQFGRQCQGQIHGFIVT